MNNIIDSCQKLFKIRVHVAKAIIPLLRIEDIKISFALNVQESIDQKNVKNIQQDNANKRKLQQLNKYFMNLTSYLKLSNIELNKDLELFSTKSQRRNSVAYFFPIYTGIPDMNGFATPKNRDLKDHFHNGSLLPKRMRFGTFLYYKGIISYEMLLKSLAWQKEQRPLLGQIAMQIGLLSPSNFATILLQTKNGFQFGAIAKKMKLLTESTIRKMVDSQNKYNCKIGKYFIENGILSDKEIDFYHKEMNLHNVQYAS